MVNGSDDSRVIHSGKKNVQTNKLWERGKEKKEREREERVGGIFDKSF